MPTVLIGIWASAPSSGIPAGTKENTVLAMLVQLHAGPVLAGLLTAGILAAIMSSLDSQFLALGTMFTHDVVLRYVRPGRLNDRHLILLARGFVCLIVVVTFLLSLYPRAVFDLGIWSFSGFCGLFPLVVAAIYWRRLTAAGAIANVLTTLVLWFALFWRANFGLDKGYAFPEAPIMVGKLTLVPQMLPVVTIMVASTLALVLVSLVTRPPDEARLKKFFG
jgi:SSS family solute:Na+ symporter